MSRFIVLIFLSLVTIHPSVAQPRGVHISWNGTKKVRTATSMGITWMNDRAEPGAVYFGTDSNHLSRKVLVWPAFLEGMQTYVSKTSLRKLKPATSYYYKVGSDRGGWSPVYRFRTAPLIGHADEFMVGIWSDTQNNEGNYNFEQTDTIVRQLARYPLDFTLHTGDIVENGSVNESWKNFFNVAQPLNANYPFMSVTGNHDVVNDTTADFQKPFPVYYQLFNLPADQLNYSYTYGNTRFIAVNSGYAQRAEKLGEVLFANGTKEYHWLETELAKARKDPAITWVILYCHYPMYSYGFSHIPAWQKQLTPLLDRFRVDLVLSGHRHVYERHAAIRDAEVFPIDNKRLYSKPKGTVFITNGSCGGSLQGLGGKDMPSMVFTPNRKMYTFSTMTIKGGSLRYDVYNKAGEKIDYFEIVK
jgi:acid phosphatase type 7